MPTPVSPVVLVVGGGFAGRAAINYLRSRNLETPLILVDEKPYFEFTPSVLRCIIQPTKVRSVTFQHAGEGFSFILGRVTHITRGEATIAHPEDGRTVMLSVLFDYCIWATGVSFCHPITSGLTGLPSIASRVDEMVRQRDELVRARRVLIVGGGAVGVELAAELVGMIRDNDVTLTLASPRILPRLPSSAGKYATRWLEKRKVCILNHRLKPSAGPSDGEYVYESPSGQTVTADIVFDCTGPRSNDAANALVAGGVCDASALNRDGTINVLQTLQIPQAPNFFVAGDAARVDGELELSRLGGEKTAYAAQEAGLLAGKNVAVLIHGEAPVRRDMSAFQQYPIDVFPMDVFPRMFVISLYKYYGILCIGPLVVTGWFPALAKVIIEFLGVRTAQSDGFSARLFRAVEGIMFWITALVTIMSKRPRRQSGDQ